MREVDEIDVKKEIDLFPLIPYPRRVYVVEEKITRIGNIIIPEVSKTDGEMQTNIGFVVGIGEGVGFCGVGDKIFYGRYSGAWVLDKKYRVMNEEDILGKFKNGGNDA